MAEFPVAVVHLQGRYSKMWGGFWSLPNPLTKRQLWLSHSCRACRKQQIEAEGPAPETDFVPLVFPWNQPIFLVPQSRARMPAWIVLQLRLGNHIFLVLQLQP